MTTTDDPKLSLNDAADEIAHIYTRLVALRAKVNKTLTRTAGTANTKATVVYHLDRAIVRVRRASFQIGKM